MIEMCSRFPGCIVVQITNPFEKVFLVVISNEVVKDLVNFEFISIVDGDRVRRRNRCRAMVDRVRRLVWVEDGYVKDWVYLKGVREVEFVGDRRDLLNDSVGADELVLQLLGWSSC